MSFVSATYPSRQEWSSTSSRTWVQGEGPIDAPVGMNWDDFNAQLSMMANMCQNGDQKTGAQLLPFKREANKFEISLDLSNFTPEEFNVKIVDKDLIVECKHEEKKDQFGWVSRQFTRKFALPNDVDIEKMKATLSSAGILTVEVPKKVFQAKEENVVYIPIIHEKDLNVGKESKDQQKSETSSDGQQKTTETTEEKSEKSAKTEINIEVKSDK